MSDSTERSLASLTTSDLEATPVWEFVADDAPDDTAVRPVNRLPVPNLANRIVGSKVRLANGQKAWALLGNLDARNAEANQHFVTISIEQNGAWQLLARYHDTDYADNGPDALSRFLKLPVDEIFPITYDVRHHVIDHPPALSGTILKEPEHRLSESELIALALS